MSVTLVNLTQRQQVLAQILWECPTEIDVLLFIDSLPTQELRNEAKSIVEMIIIESVDQYCDGTEPLDLAQELINRVKR